MGEPGAAKLKVGDQVYVVRAGLRRDSEPKCEWMPVLKVGRKWATIGDPDGKWRQDRLDLATFYLDAGGFTATARAYRSEEAYRAERDADAAWRSLRSAIDRSYRMPDGLTAERICQASALLGFDSPTPCPVGER